MNVAERIEKAIGEMLPTYHAVTDFGDNTPEKYISYELVDSGGDYGEGMAHDESYMITLNIFTPELDLGLYEFVKAAMQAAGFSYSGGGDVTNDSTYPYGRHWYQDYGG